MAKCVCILKKLFQLICGGNGKMCLYFKKNISAYLGGNGKINLYFKKFDHLSTHNGCMID